MASAPPPPARVAIVHDWLDTWAGGEQALAAILDVFPDAELFALVDFFPPEFRARIGGRHAHTSFLQHLPGARRHFRTLLPLFPRAVEGLDVAAFDLVVSSSHAVAKGVRTHDRQLHVCYCYSPIRYAWDLREPYLAQVGLDRGLRGRLARRALDRIQRWDRASSRRVDHFVAISRHIAARIERCYGRDAAVIYPPVDVPGPAAAASPGNAAFTVPARPRGPAPPRAPAAAQGHDAPYVTVSRLVPYKRIDLIAAAFRNLPDRELAIIGEGPERTRIEAAAGPNVRLLGRLPDAERDAWLDRARAFVFAADEDFGIAPVEAQAHGVPVIAYGAGGALESIVGPDDAHPTGVFFAEQTPAAIAAAVIAFENDAARYRADACRANAQRFSTARFKREFAALVLRYWNDFRSDSAR